MVYNSKNRMTYTEELAKEICDTIACTPKSTAKLCKEFPHWPSHETIYKWKRTIPEFADMYANAKRDQIEPLVDQILDISDDAKNDYYANNEGKELFDSEHVQRSRLRVDSRKWFAAKLAPRIYGDRLIINDKNDDSEARKVLETALKCMEDK